MDKVRRLYASLLFAAGLAVVVASFPADVQANGRVTNFQKKLAVRPQQPRPGPTTGGLRGRVDGHAPTGSCAGRSPGWMAP